MAIYWLQYISLNPKYLTQDDIFIWAGKKAHHTAKSLYNMLNLGMPRKILFASVKNICAGKKAHRTPKNLYILNLGVSGIATSVICIPPTLIQCLYGGKWYLGLVACKLVPTMQGTNILVSTGDIYVIYCL